MEPSPSQANSSTVSDKRLPAVLPDCFTGDPDLRWRDLLDDFELHVEVNEWDDIQRRQYLALRLEGYPRGLFRSRNAEEKSLYDSLKSALTSHFERLDQSELYCTEFRARTKRDGSNFSSSPWHFAHWLSEFFQNGACTKRSAVSRSIHRWPD